MTSPNGISGFWIRRLIFSFLNKFIPRYSTILYLQRTLYSTLLTITLTIHYNRYEKLAKTLSTLLLVKVYFMA